MGVLNYVAFNFVHALTFCDVRIHDRVSIAKARHSSLFLKSESAVSKNVYTVKACIQHQKRVHVHAGIGAGALSINHVPYSKSSVLR